MNGIVRILAIAAVALALGGCDMIKVEDWIGQQQYAYEHSKCPQAPANQPCPVKR